MVQDEGSDQRVGVAKHNPRWMRRCEDEGAQSHRLRSIQQTYAEIFCVQRQTICIIRTTYQIPG